MSEMQAYTNIAETTLIPSQDGGTDSQGHWNAFACGGADLIMV